MAQDRPLQDYFLQTTKKIQPAIAKDVGKIHVVNSKSFPALSGVTSYLVEVWEECMRLPHWHPNAAELGYVVSGKIEVIIWRTPGETAVFTLGPGMCWFIPQAALHSLNNVGNGKAVLVVGFSDDNPADIDLPVAFNGIPIPVRNSFTSPHEDLRNWQGVNNNPLVGRCPVNVAINEVASGSPYGFDLAKVTPLFSDPNMGSVIWGVKDNWHILEQISILRARLKTNTARDPIWYPDVGTLYVVTQGKGEFHIITPGQTPQPFQVGLNDYIYVPTGFLHTFINYEAEDFEVIALFTDANPIPEVSLSVSTAFFPNSVRRACMTMYATEHIAGDPLKYLNYTEVSPYLIKVQR